MKTKCSWISLVALVALLSGCASSPAVPDQTSREIDAILSQPTAELASATPRRCLSTSLYDDVDVLDERRLLFQGVGDNVWINELRHRCPGLRADDALMFELRDARVCSLDSVSVVDRFLFWTRTGPTCTLGEFVPVAKEQVAMIEDVLAND